MKVRARFVENPERRETRRYFYPEFEMPIEPRMHPQIEQVNEQLRKWSFDFKLHHEESDQYKREQMVKLACLTYPDGNLERTVLCAKFLVHIFVLDDAILNRKQGSFFGSLMNHDNCNNNVIELLDDANKDEETPVAVSFGDYWTDMKKLTKKEWQKRFAENYIWYLKGTQWEIENLNNKRTPSLAEYMEYRHYASGIDPSLNLIELSRDIFIPDSVFANPTFQRLSSIVGNVVAFANDVQSFEKERRVGEINNLVIVMKHKYKISYQEAIQKATEFVNEETKKFFAVEQMIPSFSKELDDLTKMYVQGFRDWMRGNLEWGHISGRYRRYSYQIDQF